jgi:PucR family transcriptional regulator, purine catabolism regulatory protein
MWRTFDVGALLESLAFSQAVVAAGAGGAGRRVSRARLVARPEDLQRVDAQELVVTSARTLLAAGDPEQLIARLDAAHIAGLAVRLDGPDGLPGSTVEVADRLSLPLITFPEDTALADATAAVLDALLEAQRRRLEHVLDIHQRFTSIVLAGGGAAEIAATLHDFVDCPVAVLDIDGRTTVVVPSDADIDPGHGSMVRRPIRAGAQEYGEIAVFSGSRTLDEDGLIAIERAAMGVAVRLAQASAVTEAQERFAAISLEELVADRGATSPTSPSGRPASVGISRVHARCCSRPSTRLNTAASLPQPSTRSRRRPGRRSGPTRSSGRARQRSRPCSRRRPTIRSNDARSPKRYVASSTRDFTR